MNSTDDLTNDKPRYGIYFIPPANSPFYQLGSQILGYDIRHGSTHLARPGYLPLLKHFGSAHYFGFHATIRGTFVTDRLPALLQALNVAAKKQVPFVVENGYIHAFGQNDRVVCFNLSPESDDRLCNLHEEMVGIVDHFRVRDYVSAETKSIIPNLGTVELQLLEEHGDPRVLEGYNFHFTLANRASTEELEPMDRYLESKKKDLYEIKILIDRLCLAVQQAGDPYWKIMKEYFFSE